jgi:hypothetical protein
MAGSGAARASGGMILARRRGRSMPAGKRLRGFVVGLAGGPGPVVAVSHGGVTADLLRTLAGDDALAPPCWTTASRQAPSPLSRTSK